MSLYESVRAVIEADGEGPIDWDAVATAAKEATPPGSIDISQAEQDGYASDVRAARRRIRSVSELSFELPETIEIQNRHHWIDANATTFKRVMAPLEDRQAVLPGLARRVNSASLGIMLAFLGRNVLGQYDPLLLADGDEHALYFVRPNILTTADALDVEPARFRRWIAFHEVTHAAEFGAAPWLSAELESRMTDGIESLANGRMTPSAFAELTTIMTAVEGYAEFVMDRAFDDEYADLREKVDARRRNRGPIGELMSRVLGLGLKRQQYERGKAFFDAVASQRDVAATGAVWSDPAYLPTDDEIENPRAWLRRVNP
ncbi:MAG: zinc-dependent metalloprotease [Halobacteriales archaeon]|nr:zinc-dependent metalloprotease [Halobacteriales archaeon]